MFEINTLIELFDVCPIENVVSGLRLFPERIVFVGYKEIMTSKRKQDIEEFFAMRKIKVQIEYEIVGRYNFDMIVDRLNLLVDKYPDSCFDLTGGKELVLAAMGLVAAQKNVPMVQFDIKKGALIPVRNSDMIADNMNSRLTVEENVILNGGALVRDEMSWDLNDEFKKDILTLWDISRKNCGHWNHQVTVFGIFEAFGSKGLYVDADLSYMRLKGVDTYLNDDIISRLRDAGMLENYECKNDRISFRYKNEQIQRCLTKAGNILELYVYMIAHEINNSHHGYYSDIEIGAVIDWDGKVHGYYESEVDTTNEIDILLMRGLVPVFISCKNGTVYKEALYELDAVARKIGGKYAKKILLCTYISPDAAARKYITTRCDDMNIQLLDNVQNLSQDEFKALLEKATK